MPWAVKGWRGKTCLCVARKEGAKVSKKGERRKTQLFFHTFFSFWTVYIFRKFNSCLEKKNRLDMYRMYITHIYTYIPYIEREMVEVEGLKKSVGDMEGICQCLMFPPPPSPHHHLKSRSLSPPFFSIPIGWWSDLRKGVKYFSIQKERRDGKVLNKKGKCWKEGIRIFSQEKNSFSPPFF